MSFEFGMKGYSFGLISLICWVVSILCNFIGLAVVGMIAGIAVFVFAIMAFVNGKKELAADANNKKAKTGKTIGLVVIILNVVSWVLVIVAGGLLVSAMV